MKMFKKFFAFLLLLRQTNFRQQINKILSIVFLLTLVTQIANAQAGEAEFPDWGDDENYWQEEFQALQDSEDNDANFHLIPKLVVDDTHNYVSDLFTLLDFLSTDYKLYSFDRNGAKICDLYSHHIQGVAYYNNTSYINGGYYYLTRSRKNKPYNEQLLIVDEYQRKVVNTLKLDDALSHPGGIQIYDTILVVPFNEKKTNFYSLKDPTNPRYLDSIPYMGQCAGLTEYEGNYLVALYGSDYNRNIIRFVFLDNSLKKIKDIIWNAQAPADKSNWTPYKTWQGTDTHYENMSLIKEQASPSAIPKYYLLMYHNDPEAIDVYSLNGLDFNNANPPDIQMVRRVSVRKPWLLSSGFRIGGGMYIENSWKIRFFSTEKGIANKTYINIYKTICVN